MGSDSYYNVLSKCMGKSYYQDEKYEYDYAAKFVTESDRVLDIGSGPGLFRKYVKGDYTGLDFNPSAIEQAKRDGVKVINDSINEHIRFNKSFYTVITIFQVLEHMDNPYNFIEKCLEALQPGGLLILSVPSDDSFVSLQENAVLNMPPHHISRWTDTSLFNLGKLFGLIFIDLNHEKLSEIHFDPFINTLSNMTIRFLLHWDTNIIIDVSKRKNIVDGLSKFTNYIYRKVYKNISLWPSGHSVTAVYRKSL